MTLPRLIALKRSTFVRSLFPVLLSILVGKVEAQQKGTVNLNDVPVQAGEALGFSVTLDQAPNFAGGVVGYEISGPSEVEESRRNRISTSVNAQPGQRECNGSITIPEAAKGGTWTLKVTGFFTGTEWLPLSVQPRTFQVVARKNLVFPTSGDVRITPSQVQVLRHELDLLDKQIRLLKVEVAGMPTKKTRDLLRRNITTAIEALRNTESKFNEEAVASSQSSVAAIFFNDLELNYDSVLKGLAASASADARSGRLRTAAFSQQNSSPDYTIETQAALRAFETNELAYRVASDTTSLTFDLEVVTTPPGATVFYSRRGDAEPRKLPTLTNSTIHALPLAVWYIRFKKDGFQPEEREHDPYHDPVHAINVELKKQ